MARIKFNDLPQCQKIAKKEMKDIKGGPMPDPIPFDPVFFKIPVVVGECYDVKVEADGFQSEGPIEIQLMGEGHTIRDFVLWPTSVTARPSCTIYRFQSPSTPYSYYFTHDELEINNLLFDDPDPTDTYYEMRDLDNWEFNGIAFCAFFDTSGSEKVYRYLLYENGVLANDVPPAYAFFNSVSIAAAVGSRPAVVGQARSRALQQKAGGFPGNRRRTGTPPARSLSSATGQGGECRRAG